MPRPATFAAALALAAALPLAAQSSPVGLGLSYIAPSGVAANNFNGGGALSLYVHKRMGPAIEGRFHLDLMGLPGKDFRKPDGAGDGQYKSEAKAIGLGYDWLLHFDGIRAPGAYALIGVGGIRWNEEFTAQSDPGSRTPYHVVDSNDFTSFALTIGLGVRLTRNLGLEVRHTEARTDKIRFFGESERFVDAGFSHTSLGMAFRF
ncbi:MAG: outer membrane beta-barrel protein [Holophagaceae bacterium]|nr:outer membrane beta-barrel protein [Holophagaceae bacterium]